jgi:hypothetical protein
MSLGLDEDTCCHPQSLGELGQLSSGHVQREKGVGFVPGGPIPENIRTTAWQFMGQEIPQNYGKLVFGIPLARKAEFDPKSESIHGLLSS